MGGPIPPPRPLTYAIMAWWQSPAKIKNPPPCNRKRPGAAAPGPPTSSSGALVLLVGAGVAHKLAGGLFHGRPAHAAEVGVVVVEGAADVADPIGLRPILLRSALR